MRYRVQFTAIITFLIHSLALGATVDRPGLVEAEIEVVNPQVQYDSVSLPGLARQPIETVANHISANPRWGLNILEAKPSSIAEASSQEAAGPFRSDEEVEEFLRTAKVVSRKQVDEGINDIEKVLLEKDGIRMQAAFRDVRIRKNFIKLANGKTQTNFRDDCVYEVAAYRVSRLLGLDNVPPVVSRKIGRNSGTLQLWIPNTMMEKERWKKKIQPPHPVKWTHQWQIIRLFDNLIYNEDRNSGNTLIDADWKLWMIDHTRAFRRNKELRNPQIVRFCPRSVWSRLRTLDKQVVKRELKGVLNKSEIEALMVRCNLLVQHIQKLIDRKGAGAVLF